MFICLIKAIKNTSYKSFKQMVQTENFLLIDKVPVNDSISAGQKKIKTIGRNNWPSEMKNLPLAKIMILLK